MTSPHLLNFNQHHPKQHLHVDSQKIQVSSPGLYPVMKKRTWLKYFLSSLLPLFACFFFPKFPVTLKKHRSHCSLSDPLPDLALPPIFKSKCPQHDHLHHPWSPTSPCPRKPHSSSSLAHSPAAPTGSSVASSAALSLVKPRARMKRQEWYW